MDKPKQVAIKYTRRSSYARFVSTDEEDELCASGLSRWDIPDRVRSIRLCYGEGRHRSTKSALNITLMKCECGATTCQQVRVQFVYDEAAGAATAFTIPGTNDARAFLWSLLNAGTTEAQVWVEYQ
jgi:hypothetical protein